MVAALILTQSLYYTSCWLPLRIKVQVLSQGVPRSLGIACHIVWPLAVHPFTEPTRGMCMI